ncbi:MAG: sodium:solute symporter family protein [Planctomycetota bacterium]
MFRVFLSDVGAEAASGDSVVPFIVLGAYLAFLLVLGIVSYLKSHASEEDYYLAGRGQSWLVSALTIMATFFSSWALLGAPGKVYNDGLIFALFALNVPFSGAMIVALGRGICKLGKSNRYVTPGDMIADYYGGDAVRVLTALTCVLYVVPYVVMQIQAGGVLFDALLDEPLVDWADNFTVGSILLACVTTVYIMIGGMRSVAWTDVFQGALLVVGMLLGGYVVVTILGGLEGFSQKVAALPDAWLTAPGATGTWAPLFLCTVCTVGAAGTMVSPAQWMRYYAADSTRTLRRSAIIFSVVLTACFLFGVMLVGIGAQVLYPCPVDTAGAPIFENGKLVINEAVGNADEILVLVLKEHLPVVLPGIGIWLASIMVMAIAAGSMSTADSNLHALSAVFTRDIYDRYLRKNASTSEKTWVGRVVIFVATAISLILVIGARSQKAAGGGVLADSMQMIVDVGILAISFSAQLVPVAVDMLWIRRGSRAGAAFGIATGLIVTFVVWRAGAPFQGTSIGPVELKMMHGAWGIVANALVFVIVSAMTKKDTKAQEFTRELES